MSTTISRAVVWWCAPWALLAACSTNASHTCPDASVDAAMGTPVDVATAQDVPDASTATDVVMGADTPDAVMSADTPDVTDVVMSTDTPDVTDVVMSADTPDVQEPLAPIGAVAAGTLHTCALRAGRVFCWGDNTLGQLGVAGIDRALAPVEVPGLRDAVEVSVDGNASCARRIDNSVTCWGQSIAGQLGAGVPIGQNLVRPTPVPGVRDALSLTLGSGYTCITRLGGTVWCWGSNRNYQLGDGMGGPNVETATPVQATGLSGVVQLAAGQFTCAVRDDGKVFCWGLNFAGETASTASPTPSPSEVPGVANAVHVGVGSGFGCAVVQSGQVFCWGDNRLGQLGDRTLGLRQPPAAVPGVTDAVRLAVGWTSVCALRRNGTVVCWGQGARGELGAGMLMQTSAAPVAVPMLTDVVQLSGFAPVSAVQANHRCALRRGDTDRLWCWGFNSAGQLGDGTTTDRPAPVRATAVP